MDDSASEKIKSTIKFVKWQLQDAEGGHDWQHMQRVWKMAIHLAQEKVVDNVVLELGALLHDIGDHKFDHERDGKEVIKVFMKEIGVEDERIRHILQIHENISYSSSLADSDFHSQELAILQDADRLDAIGAIGIARAFNYGGFKDNPIYIPGTAPRENMSKKEYRNHKSTTINHFYEKLLNLKDMMNTDEGRKIAAERHRFMEEYLEQFYSEIKPLSD